MPEPAEAAASSDRAESAHVEAAEMAEAAAAADTPRWGRRSTIAAAQQAIRRTRSARPRWLPPWLPFLIVLLAVAAIVATNVSGQPGGRNPSGDATRDTIVVRLAPTATRVPDGLVIAAATSVATSVALAGGGSTQSSPSETPAQAPALTTSASPTATPRPRTSPVSSVAVTMTSTRPAMALPPPGAQVTPPVALPAEASPEGPIVAAYTSYSTYTVRQGDTLNRVATMFGVSGETIMRSSGLTDPNLLLPGQVLTIPRESGWLYRVQPGDTLELIGLRFGVSTDDLMAANHLTAPVTHVGDLLFIPSRGAPNPK